LLHIQDSKSAEHLHKYEKSGLVSLLPDATTCCSSVSSPFRLKIKVFSQKGHRRNAKFSIFVTFLEGKIQRNPSVVVWSARKARWWQAGVMLPEAACDLPGGSTHTFPPPISASTEKQ